MVLPTLQQQRARILEQMAAIDHMIRGHVSTQTYRVQRQGQTVILGPYYVLQRHQNGRNQCQRLSDADVEQITAHVLAYKRFMELADRYAALTEQLTWDQQSDVVKKKFRRFWPPASPKRPLS
jgi:hypothetical protein